MKCRVKKNQLLVDAQFEDGQSEDAENILVPLVPHSNNTACFWGGKILLQVSGECYDP